MPKKEPWISVNDRLPESGSLFLVYGDWSFINPNTIRIIDYRICFFAMGEFISYGEMIKGVTHYMPLPLPPQK